MAFLKIVYPDLGVGIFNKTLLYAIGRCGNDAELRENLRLIAAILVAHWSETITPEEHSINVIDLINVVTDPQFYEKGFSKTNRNAIAEEMIEEQEIFGMSSIDERLWFCSYIGFEKLTSKWSKENIPDCHGVICMRVFNQDKFHRDCDSHTIQIFY